MRVIMKPGPDRQTIERARGGGAGAEEAFRDIYEATVDEVFGFLSRLIWDRALVEDAVQESYVRLFRGFGGFDPERPFRPFLFKMAHRAGLDLLRANKGKPRFGDELSATSKIPAASELASRRELDGLIAEALRSLAPEVRAVLALRHGEAMKIKDIAEVLGCAERTARTRLKTAGVLFERELRKRHVLTEEA